MADLTSLLRHESSFLARMYRAALGALTETLQTSYDQAPDTDPGRPTCAALLRELNAALATPPRTLVSNSDDVKALSPQELSVPSPSQVPAALSLGTTCEASGLEGLRREFLASPGVKAEFGSIALPQADSPEFWLQMNLFLLRASESLAALWRARLDSAVGPRQTTDTAALTRLPYDRREMLFTGLGPPSAAPGLALAADAPLDARLRPGPCGGRLDVLARIVTIALWLTEADPCVQHALRSVYRFGWIPVQGKQRSNYQRALVDRFHRACDVESGQDAAQLLQARLDLDEAIHSLLYVPPAPPLSWWARLQRRARDTLHEVKERLLAAGHSVHLQEMAGRYADIRPLTDAESNREIDVGCPPGEVAVCLRLFARLDGLTLPGRVFYRPL